jgi:hypothetical protein
MDGNLGKPNVISGSGAKIQARVLHFLGGGLSMGNGLREIIHIEFDVCDAGLRPRVIF